MACSQYISTKETTHAARVSRLLLDPCTDLFRDILRNHVTEVQFPFILQKEKNTLSPILNKAQREKLYPRSGNFTGTYDVFDLSLLYILLRNISGITPHQKGWGKSPDPSDRSLSANIDRIREIRNTYCGHAVSVSLLDAEFLKLWQDLTIIITELEGSLPGGCTTYTDAANIIKTVTMDPEQEKRFLDMIDQQHQSTADLKKIMSGITTNLKNQNVNLNMLELRRVVTDVDITELEINQKRERTELEKVKYEQDKQRTELNDLSTNLARLEKLSNSEKKKYETSRDDREVDTVVGETTWSDDELYYVVEETPSSGELYYIVEETSQGDEEVDYVVEETPSNDELYYIVKETARGAKELFDDVVEKPLIGNLDNLIEETARSAARGAEKLLDFLEDK
ncbi:E3 ubiquitin-protein ligase DZIP3-like [Saccostrea echinata]|uniref:E3 ubiquitin-protein ligase DZIP3-like n=1 Tax=Saccostrea echinata TaxID=191078 RepID=UPI002A80B504|nr:E3 ubiquitin-protein ligase DZIP3-like [Saccostrea echinata]